MSVIGGLGQQVAVDGYGEAVALLSLGAGRILAGANVLPAVARKHRDTYLQYDTMKLSWLAWRISCAPKPA
jgi:hypothetical protein